MQGLAQDMEGQKAVAKMSPDHPVMLRVSTVGSGAEESPISAVIWVEGSSPMGTAQPPTSAPSPATLSTSPGPRWDWKNLLGDQTRSSAGMAQAAEKAGTRAQAALGHLPPQGSHQTNLYLLKGDLKAEGLIEVGVQGLLLDCGLLLLQPLAILQQVDLHVGIWGSGWGISQG